MTLMSYWVPEIEEVNVTKIKKVFLASHHQWSGVLAQGDTIDEAVARWHENRDDRESDLSIHDVPFPEYGDCVWADHPVQCYRHNGMVHITAKSEPS